eukprot:6184375-Pleurochrysis_carterae.AAC.3
MAACNGTALPCCTDCTALTNARVCTCISRLELCDGLSLRCSECRHNRGTAWSKLDLCAAPPFTFIRGQVTQLKTTKIAAEPASYKKDHSSTSYHRNKQTASQSGIFIFHIDYELLVPGTLETQRQSRV